MVFRNLFDVDEFNWGECLGWRRSSWIGWQKWLVGFLCAINILESVRLRSLHDMVGWFIPTFTDRGLQKPFDVADSTNVSCVQGRFGRLMSIINLASVVFTRSRWHGWIVYIFTLTDKPFFPQTLWCSKFNRARCSINQPHMTPAPWLGASWAFFFFTHNVHLHQGTTSRSPSSALFKNHTDPNNKVGGGGLPLLNTHTHTHNTTTHINPMGSSEGSRRSRWNKFVGGCFSSSRI